MRKIVAGMFMSLDGVMESPEKWTGQYMNDEMVQAIGSQMAASDTMLLGRRTYQDFAAVWPSRTTADFGPVADFMNTTPKLVVSKTLETVDWQNSTLVQGDVVAELTKLKQQAGKNMTITGSATLVRSLLHEGLLDELNLLVPPIVVGSGRRLFEEKNGELRLRLVDSKTFGNGVLSLIYARA
jgi:dihydrofolate reductase